MYFGTQSGSVWTAPPGGDEWIEAVRDLPPILSVEAATRLTWRSSSCRERSRRRPAGRSDSSCEAAPSGRPCASYRVANLLFDEAGELRRLVNVYVDSVDVRGGRLLDEPLTDESEVRIVGAVAGG